MPLALPPLRDRGKDLLLLARHFLRQYSAEEGRGFDSFSPETEAMLFDYPWPGNARQLQNVLRQVVLLNEGGGEVTPDMLPPPVAQPGLHLQRLALAAPAPAPYLAGPPRAAAPVAESFSLAEMERGMIELALDQAGGNVLQAASALGISPSTLYRKREQFQPGDRRGAAPRELKPLAVAETEMIRAAIAACGGNISRSATLLGINPSTLYRKMQNKELAQP